MALTKQPTPDPGIFDPNAPHAPTPYPGEETPPEATQLPTNLPDPDADPDKAWMNYGVQAINILYPWARNGVDFAWGRTEHGGDARLLEWSDKLAPADEGKIEEVARGLAAANPYVDYQPKPSLSGGYVRNAPDEVQPRPQY